MRCLMHDFVAVKWWIARAGGGHCRGCKREGARGAGSRPATHQRVLWTWGFACAGAGPRCDPEVTEDLGLPSLNSSRAIQRLISTISNEVARKIKQPVTRSKLAARRPLTKEIPRKASQQQACLTLHCCKPATPSTTTTVGPRQNTQSSGPFQREWCSGGASLCHGTLLSARPSIEWPRRYHAQIASYVLSFLSRSIALLLLHVHVSGSSLAQHEPEAVGWSCRVATCPFRALKRKCCCPVFLTAVCIS